MHHKLFLVCIIIIATGIKHLNGNLGVVTRSSRQIDITSTATTVIVGPTGPTNPTNPTSSPINIVSPGSYILNPGNVVQIVIYRIGRAFSGTTWNFQANNCLLDATCPCVGIPASKYCLDGYLKIKTGLLWDQQKYCGGNRPYNLTSDSGQLSLTYNPSSKATSTGVTCFVSCTAYGQMHATLPTVQC